MNYIKEAGRHIQIDEGIRGIEQFLITVYLESPLSNKEVARRLLLPIPLVTAIKKEFIKLGLVKQHQGITMTKKGIIYVEEIMGYKDIDRELYIALSQETINIDSVMSEELEQLNRIFSNRPSADRSIDQAHCTSRTSLRRALLSVKHRTLINKRILCVGDDDLVCISLGILLKKLYGKRIQCHTKIHVVDIDIRYLSYIQSVAEALGLPVQCHQHDLRKPLSETLMLKFDCFYTDPPYTEPGMKLFVSRGVSSLKPRKGLPIFFSYGHKSYDDTLNIMWVLSEMGLSVQQIMPKFNQYEGGAVIGNISQMFVLNTTSFTKASEEDGNSFNGDLYTRQVKTNSFAERGKGGRIQF